MPVTPLGFELSEVFPRW